MTDEEWRPVVGWPDYAVSSHGRVMSFKWGKRRILRPGTEETGHLKVVLATPGTNRSRPIHQLVLEAFCGPRPEGMEVRHLDGVPTNNHLENLRWGTKSENMQDRLRHGTHPQANKTECLRGHPFTEENTTVSGGARYCRACKRQRQREYLARRAANVSAAA